MSEDLAVIHLIMKGALATVETQKNQKQSHWELPQVTGLTHHSLCMMWTSLDIRTGL